MKDFIKNEVALGDPVLFAELSDDLNGVSLRHGEVVDALDPYCTIMKPDRTRVKRRYLEVLNLEPNLQVASERFHEYRKALSYAQDSLTAGEAQIDVVAAAAQKFNLTPDQVGELETHLTERGIF